MVERFPFSLPPGINSDDTTFGATGQWADGSNVRFYNGRPQTLGGEVSLQSVAVETYTGTVKLFAYKVGSQVHIAVAGEQVCYTVDASDWTSAAIDDAAWANFTRVSMDMFGDVLLACGKGDTIRESSSGATFTVIANAPDNITTMLVTPSRQVMALGCNEETSGTFNSRCIRWSDIEDRTDWTTSSSNNAGEYILPGQEAIVGARLLGNYIVVWTSGSLWLGQYIGDPGQTFIFTRVAPIGLLAQDAHGELNGTIYWIGSDHAPYMWSIGGFPQQIPCTVLNTFRENVSIGLIGLTHCYVNRQFGEVWFFYGTSGSVCNRYIAYAVTESGKAGRPVWFKGSKSYDATIDSPLLLDSSVDTPTLARTTSVGINGGASQVLQAFDAKDAASGPTWSLTSSDYYVEEGKRRVQIQRFMPDFELQDGNVSLDITMRQNMVDDTINTASTQTITTTTEKSDFRASGRLISAQFSGTAQTHFGKPCFEAVVLGQR